MIYIDKEIFKKNLKALMANRNIKAVDVYSSLGINKATFSGWYTGRSLPSAPMITKLADYFKVTPEELLGQESPRSQHHFSLAIDKNDSDNPNMTVYTKDGKTLTGKEADELVKKGKMIKIVDDGSGTLDQLKFAVECLEKGLISMEEFNKVKDIIFSEMI